MNTTGRPKKRRKRPSVTITLDPDLYNWVNREIETHRFSTLSHALDRALYKLKEELEEGQAS